MMKKAVPVFMSIVLTLGMILSLNAGNTYESLQGPTETRYWDEAGA